MGSNSCFSKIIADVFPPWHRVNTHLNLFHMKKFTQSTRLYSARDPNWFIFWLICGYDENNYPDFSADFWGNSVCCFSPCFLLVTGKIKPLIQWFSSQKHLRNKATRAAGTEKYRDDIFSPKLQAYTHIHTFLSLDNLPLCDSNEGRVCRRAFMPCLGAHGQHLLSNIHAQAQVQRHTQKQGLEVQLSVSAFPHRF